MSKAASPKSARPSTSSPADSTTVTANYRVDPKAEEFMKAADKQLNKSKIASLFSGNNRFEEATDLLLKAAAQYKVSKNWNEAGSAYVKAAEIYETNLKEVFESCTHYINAAKAYKNVNTKLAMKYFQLAVELHMENNRFSTAAKLWKEMAEINEKSMDLKDALMCYQKAADCYVADDSQANASACSIKVANLAAELEDYKKAIEIYEAVSTKALEGSSAGRWGVKDYLIKALLCHFVLAAKSFDLNSLEEAVDRYQNMSPQLVGTRELKLVEDLIHFFKESDVDGFSDAVFRHDEIYKLDNWTAKVLLEVKNALKNGPEEQEQDFR